VWDEYRYDALGRRIMVRERRDDLSNQMYAYSTLDRVIWDGNQVLFELRAPGGSTANLDGAAIGSPNPPYGSVGYLHGRDLDEPLALLNQRVPLRSWRGAGETSVWTTGQAADCSRMNPCDGVSIINWPESRWSADMAPWDASGGSTPYLYVGSLLMGSQDGTGLMYRRNRYYDPQSGRFTQIDPIGIAGGVNAYGFAGGDPVTYADPFGDTIEVKVHNVRVAGVKTGEYHASIRITPNDQKRWSSDPRFSQRDEKGRVFLTLGAALGGGGELVSGVDRPTDVGPQDASAVVPTPGGENAAIPSSPACCRQPVSTVLPSRFRCRGTPIRCRRPPSEAHEETRHAAPIPRVGHAQLRDAIRAHRSWIPV